MAANSVIAVDLGAESGRVIRFQLQNNKISQGEPFRFPNTPVMANGTLYWDVLSLWRGIQDGIRANATDARSIGVDTWGVDFALLDRDGRLVANPVHYRDHRTDNVLEWVFEQVPRREIFERTGIQFLQFNGAMQMASMVRDDSPLFDVADTFLTIADLFNYWLTGSKTCEFTHVTTQQAYNPHIGNWDLELMGMIGIPTDIFPPIVQPGTRIGTFDDIPVVVPSCHDTGSAVVAVPTTTENFAYLSSGTWSLLGLEIKQPIITDAVYNANLTNEGGVEGTYRLLKNIMGLWLIQQCRRTWQSEGQVYDYSELAQLAEDAIPFQSLIEPDDLIFLPPGDMPARIRQRCAESGQVIPDSVGQVVRTIIESLALKYRHVLNNLIDVSGKQVDVLHIIGGGSQNTLLSQFTADAIGRPVIAGPIEATALGNALVQYIALGELANLAEARELLSVSESTVRFEPRNCEQWDEQYERFCMLWGELLTT